jgi:hypothetical protein
MSPLRRSLTSFKSWLTYHAPNDRAAARVVACAGDLDTFPISMSRQRIEAALVGRGARARDLEVFDALWVRYNAFLGREEVLRSLARDENPRVWSVLLATSRTLVPRLLRDRTFALVRRCLAANPDDTLPAAAFVVQLLGNIEHGQASPPPLLAMPSVAEAKR